MTKKKRSTRKTQPRRRKSIGQRSKAQERREEAEKLSRDWKARVAEANPLVRGTLRAQLKLLRQPGETNQGFARRLKIPRATFDGWLNGSKYLPQLDRLVTLTNVQSVSLDALVGRPVARHWTDRAPIGALARELVRAVVDDYCRREGTSERALRRVARLVHGTIQPVESDTTIAGADTASPNADLRVVVAGTNGATAIRVKPESVERFLKTVCEWAARHASVLEQVDLDRRSEDVRAKLRNMLDRAEVLFDSETQAAEREIYKAMIREVLNPGTDAFPISEPLGWLAGATGKEI
jgi:hypothetical protein